MYKQEFKYLIRIVKPRFKDNNIYEIFTDIYEIFTDICEIFSHDENTGKLVIKKHFNYYPEDNSYFKPPKLNWWTVAAPGIYNARITNYMEVFSNQNDE